MPNWTTNEMRIHEDDLDLIVNEKGEVDFNLIRPMPGDIITSNWGVRDKAAERIARGETDEMPEGPLTYEQQNGNKVSIESPTLDDWKAYGEIQIANKQAYGASNWYDWSVANWGTKWNVSSTDIWKDGNDTYRVSFQTAWSQPDPEMMDEMLVCMAHPEELAFEASYEGEFCITDIHGNDIVSDYNRPETWEELERANEKLQFFTAQLYWETEDGDWCNSLDYTKEEFEEARERGSYIWCEAW